MNATDAEDLDIGQETVQMIDTMDTGGQAEGQGHLEVQGEGQGAGQGHVTEEGLEREVGVGATEAEAIGAEAVTAGVVITEATVTVIGADLVAGHDQEAGPGQLRRSRSMVKKLLSPGVPPLQAIKTIQSSQKYMNLMRI